MPLLFSYGTLQLPAVQHEIFGRDVTGTPDAITGFRVEAITFTDELTVRLTGTTQHKMLHATGNPADRLAGAVLAVDDSELAAADVYETDAYRRILVETEGGRQAFVYVDAGEAA